MSISTDPQAETDNWAVDQFSLSMRERLEEKRATGRGGWFDPEVCGVDDLASQFFSNLERKADPVDLANYAMMIHLRDPFQEQASLQEGVKKWLGDKSAIWVAQFEDVARRLGRTESERDAARRELADTRMELEAARLQVEVTQKELEIAQEELRHKEELLSTA